MVSDTFLSTRDRHAGVGQRQVALLGGRGDQEQPALPQSMETTLNNIFFVRRGTGKLVYYTTDILYRADTVIYVTGYSTGYPGSVVL